MEFNIQTVIEKLKKARKVFTSEADFQLEMAWIIKETYPNAKVRMEFCPSFCPSMHIDILVMLDDKWIPIELKYKTKKCKLSSIDGEEFILKDHSAKDINCYLYLKDIERIERIKEKTHLFYKGYAILLTNDQSYPKKPRKADCVYKQFSLENGATKTGIMQWSETTGTGTKKKKEAPIILKGSYNVQWSIYSEFNDSSAGTFHILVNTIS